MKIIRFLEDFGLFAKGVTKAIDNEMKEQRGGFLGMPLGYQVLLSQEIYLQEKM